MSKVMHGLLNARELKSKARILVVRNDGLGDFVLSTPLLAAIKKQRPDAQIWVLINQNLSGLTALLPFIDGAIADTGVLLKRHRRLAFANRDEKYQALLEEIKSKNFDVAIFPYSEGGTAKIIQLASIPWRIGTIRRWHSWRFNQHNLSLGKRSGLSEYQRGLSFLPLIGLQNEYTAPEVKLSDTPAILQPWISQPYVVIHPYKANDVGLSWPIENFVELSQKCLAKGWRVAVIGSDSDHSILKDSFSEQNDKVKLFINSDWSLLATLIKNCILMIGNSSGPLHLAALLGKRHIGLFPRCRSASIQRWQTLPPFSNGSLLAPDVPVDCQTCHREKCSYYSCMNKIDVVSVWNQITPQTGV